MAYHGGTDFLFWPIGGAFTSPTSAIPAQTIGLTVCRRGTSGTIGRRTTTASAEQIEVAEHTVALED